MICSEIRAEILTNKLHEFNQSKMVFIENLQNTEGYLGFTEKPGDAFQMKISWKSRRLLDKFIKSEHYRVFRGAIITLSHTNSIEITIERKKENQNK